MPARMGRVPLANSLTVCSWTDTCGPAMLAVLKRWSDASLLVTFRQFCWELPPLSIEPSFIIAAVVTRSTYSLPSGDLVKELWELLHKWHQRKYLPCSANSTQHSSSPRC